MVYGWIFHPNWPQFTYWKLLFPLDTKSEVTSKYRVIHNAFRDFRPLRNISRDEHAEGEHVNRGRETPIFCPNLQVLDQSVIFFKIKVDPIFTLTIPFGLTQYVPTDPVPATPIL